MRVFYLYNSGFAVFTDTCLLIFDHYRNTSSTGSGLSHGTIDPETLRRDNVYVFASHSHPDHFNPEVLSWRNINPDIKYILGFDIKGKVQPEKNVTFLEKGAEFDDGRIYVKALGSTDEGVSFFVKVDGQRVFHAGDLNLWHWKDESTAAEVADATNRFYMEMESVRNLGDIDVAFFPVDSRMGTDFYEGAQYFLETIRPKHFIPMHFFSDFSAVKRFISGVNPGNVKIWRITKRGEQMDII